ncbi:hypothetical protein R1sor_023404 [Riccia sorocarpa]|uniref:Malectin-like domain-containing protein n=1 Tax=Riccia sorocarpa TaxID=122646 RepID=A0ABD3GMJ0_9MARC
MQLLTIINAQADPRFLVLSIDCGAPSPYKDSALGIEWQTDQNYTTTGTSVQMKEGTDLPKQLYRYRVFTSGRNKDCYTLPVKPQTTYLLRVGLYPGDGGPSSVNITVDFNVSVNSNHWFEYTSDGSDVTQEAAFYSFELEEVYLCLLKGTQGTPFISSIELRILPSNGYADTKSTQIPPSFLVLGDRLNMGVKSSDDKAFRFPDDEFDRFWRPALPPDFPRYARADGSSILSELPFSSSYDPEIIYQDLNQWPPNKTLIDAWVGRDLSFNITRERVDTGRIVATFFYMEIRPNVNISELSENNPEEIFDAFGEDYEYVDITDRLPTAFQYVTNIEGNLGDAVLVNVSWQFGPFDKIILNGFEYYYLYEVNIDATYSPDREILASISDSFGLNDWRGDPCYPVPWDWVSCDSTSRIQTLNLTGMKLSGPIPGNISTLTELTEIHLNNNKLSGPIPESLASLTKLKILAVDNNQLTGVIPVQLLNKPGLKFTFSGNPGLQLTRTGSPSPGPSPAVRSSATMRSSLSSDVVWRTTTLLLSICILVFFR